MERGAYTVAEAAEWLGRSSDTIRRLVDEGALPAVKVRGTQMIARAALERLVDPTYLDLRGITTEDLGRIVASLTARTESALADPSEHQALSSLRDRLSTRLAYAEALAEPLALERAS